MIKVFKITHNGVTRPNVIWLDFDFKFRQIDLSRRLGGNLTLPNLEKNRPKSTLSQCKDLGVIITSELSPSLHIQHITATAHQRANSILRCFVSGNVKWLVRPCIVYVITLLEYNYVIWSPLYHEDRKSPATFYYKTSWPQTPVVQRSLKQTWSSKPWTAATPWLHLDLVYCYKIVFGVVKLNFSNYFDFSVAPTRGHLYQLYKYRCDSVRAGFFASRVVNVWNSLPESVVFTGLSVFKRSNRRF